MKQKYCIPVDDILDKYMFIYYSLSINECEPNFFFLEKAKSIILRKQLPILSISVQPTHKLFLVSSVSVEYFQAKVIKLYLSIIYY